MHSLTRSIQVVLDGDIPLDEDPRYDEALREYREAVERKDKESCDRARFKLSALATQAGYVRND